MKSRAGKYVFRIVLIAFVAGRLVFGCCYLLPSFSHDGINVKAKLVVNGEQMKEKCVIYQHGTEGPLQSSIPMLAVLDGLGNPVVVGEEGASVTVETETGEYLVKGHDLCQKGELVLELPGKSAASLEYKARAGELYCIWNGGELLQVLDSMGTSDVIITLDPKTREVTVSRSITD